MAELPDRDKREIAFASKLGKLSAVHRRELKALLLARPDPADKPHEFSLWQAREDAFWRKIESETNGALLATLLIIWMDSAILHGMPHKLAMEGGYVYAVDKADLVSRQMNQHSKNLIARTIEKGTQRATAEVAKARSATVGSGGVARLTPRVPDILTKKDVLELTTKVFGPKRVARVAQTETVRAQNHGAKSAVRASGKMLVAYWRHSELRPAHHAGAVIDPCPICTPLEGTPWWFWGGLTPGDGHISCDCYYIFLDPANGIFLGGDPSPPGLQDWAEKYGIPAAPMSASFGPANALGQLIGESVEDWGLRHHVMEAVWERIESGLPLMEDFDESDHPRDDHGKFVAGGAIDAAKSDAGKAQALRAEVTRPKERKKLDVMLGDKAVYAPARITHLTKAEYGGHAGTSADPIRCGKNLDLAVRALADGKSIELRQPEQIATLLHKMDAIVKDAQARGEKAPNYNLCSVAVAGSNLFCQDSKGIPRAQMPQMKGLPIPGSPAADPSNPRDKNGKVDLSQKFIASLKKQGYVIEERTVLASHLRASQNEIIGTKIAHMVDQAEKGKRNLIDAPIFVTSDHYVLDGHHHWAADVGLGYAQGKEVKVPVHMIHGMDIGKAIDLANKFAKEQGIAPKVAPKIGESITEAESGDEGHWVTIDGTHVKIKGAGEIVAGPKGMERKKLSDLGGEHHPESPEGKKAAAQAPQKEWSYADAKAKQQAAFSKQAAEPKPDAIPHAPAKPAPPSQLDPKSSPVSHEPAPHEPKGSWNKLKSTVAPTKVADAFVHTWVQQHDDHNVYEAAHHAGEHWVDGLKNSETAPIDQLYEDTQAKLKSAGIKSVNGFRGIHLPLSHPLAKAILSGKIGVGDVAKFAGAKFVSWSTSAKVAHGFSKSAKEGTIGIVFSRHIEAAQIVSGDHIHVGFYSKEHEVLAAQKGPGTFKIAKITIYAGTPGEPVHNKYAAYL